MKTEDSRDAESFEVRYVTHGPKHAKPCVQSPSRNRWICAIVIFCKPHLHRVLCNSRAASVCTFGYRVYFSRKPLWPSVSRVHLSPDIRWQAASLWRVCDGDFIGGCWPISWIIARQPPVIGGSARSEPPRRTLRWCTIGAAGGMPEQATPSGVQLGHAGLVISRAGLVGLGGAGRKQKHTTGDWAAGRRCKLSEENEKSMPVRATHATHAPAGGGRLLTSVKSSTTISTALRSASPPLLGLDRGGRCQLLFCFPGSQGQTSKKAQRLGGMRAVLPRRSGRRPRFGCGMVSTVTSVEATAPVDVADIRARCANIKSHIPVPAALHDLNQKVRAADAAQAPSIVTLSCVEVSDQARGRRCT